MSIYVSVEQVDVTITASTEPVTVNLSKGQDETKCVPFWTVRHVSGAITDQWQDRLGEVEIVDNAGTAAVRVSASARADAQSTTFSVFVVEFAAAINVNKYDVTTLTETNNTVDITVTDVDSQSSAFFIYSYQYTNPPASDDDFDDGHVRALWNGASTTSITLQRQGTGGDCLGTLYVVDCDSTEFTVEQAIITVSSSTATSGSATIASTVIADTFILHSYETSEGADDMLDGSWVADLDSTTSVRVQRGVGGTPAATSFHTVLVVECQNNEWDVQHDSFTSTSTTVDDTFTTGVDTDRSLIIAGCHNGCPTSSTRNDSLNGNDIDEEATALIFLDTDTVRAQKKSTTITDGIMNYQVIQMESLEVVDTSYLRRYEGMPAPNPSLRM